LTTVEPSTTLGEIASVRGLRRRPVRKSRPMVLSVITNCGAVSV
jgi:hypothetical protein